MSTHNHQKNQPRWKVGASNPREKYPNAKFVKRDGYWYQQGQNPAPKPQAPPAPAPKPAPSGPLLPEPGAAPGLPEKMYGMAVPEPWRQQLATMDHQERQAIDNARQVQGWLGSASTAVADYATRAQNEYLANLGQIGNSVAGAAGIPGGDQYGSQGHMNQAGAQLASGTNNTAQQLGQHQAAMAKIMPTQLSQAHLAAMAQTAAGIPAQYQQRRNEAMARLDELMYGRHIDDRNFREDHKRWGVAQRKDDARYRDSLLMQQQEALAGLLGDTEHIAPPDINSLPAGKTIVPKDDGGWSIIDDPGYSSSGADGNFSASNGEYPENKLRKEGFVGGWAVKPKSGGPFVQSADTGKWFKKPGSGSGGSGGSNLTAGERANLNKAAAFAARTRKDYLAQRDNPAVDDDGNELDPLILWSSDVADDLMEEFGIPRPKALSIARKAGFKDKPRTTTGGGRPY